MMEVVLIKRELLQKFFNFNPKSDEYSPQA